MRLLEVVETCFATKFQRSDPATKKSRGLTSKSIFPLCHNHSINGDSNANKLFHGNDWDFIHNLLSILEGRATALKSPIASHLQNTPPRPRS